MTVLSTAELLQKTDFKRVGDLKKFLRDNRIPFLEAKGEPITTEAAIQRVLDGQVWGGPDWRPYEGKKNTKRSPKERDVVLRQASQVDKTLQGGRRRRGIIRRTVKADQSDA